jgi:hypothetical protein
VIKNIGIKKDNELANVIIMRGDNQRGEIIHERR